MHQWKLNILSNDAKRMYSTVSEEFIPYPGMALRGYIEDHEVKVSAVVYHRASKVFHISLAWMSIDPMLSEAMLENGWEKL